jgi:hypothetical protein
MRGREPVRSRVARDGLEAMGAAGESALLFVLTIAVPLPAHDPRLFGRMELAAFLTDVGTLEGQQGLVKALYEMAACPLHASVHAESRRMTIWIISGTDAAPATADA